MIYEFQNSECVDYSLPESVRFEARRQELKAFRMGVLSKTDWTQLPDVDLTPNQVQECREYRAFIRSIPEIFPDLNTVILPEPPPYLII
jgi:hypothetical protein